MAAFSWVVFFFLVAAVHLSTAVSSKISEPSNGNFLPEYSKLLRSFDKELSTFTKAFASSSAGKLLSSVVDSVSATRNTSSVGAAQSFPIMDANKVQIVQLPGQAITTSPLDTFDTGPPQRNNILLNTFMTIMMIFASIPYLMTMTNHGTWWRHFFAAQIAVAYGLMAFVLIMLNGLLEDWIVCVLALLPALGCYFLEEEDFFSRKFLYACTYVGFLLLAANLLYVVHSGIPNNVINPAYCGIAGLIFNTGIIQQNYFFLKVLYFACLIIIGAILHLCMPGYVYDRTLDISEKEEALDFINFVFGFFSTWSTTGLFMQVIWFFGLIDTNPASPISFFYIPSQVRWNHWEAYVMLIVWAIFITGVVEHRMYGEDKLDENNSKKEEKAPSETYEFWRYSA